MRGSPIVFTDFSGGVNKVSSPYGLSTNQCQDCLNVNSTEVGTIKKRDGSSVWTQSFAVPNWDLSSIFYSQPTTYTVVVGSVGGSSSFAFGKVDTAGTVTNITGTVGSPASALTWAICDGPPGNTIYFNTPLSGGNPQKWDQSAGTTSTWTATSGTVPRGRCMVYHGDRLWVAGNASNTERLYFSDLDLPSAWSTSNFVDIDLGSTGIIEEILPFGPYLLVFKSSKTYLVYDLDTGEHRQVSESIGLNTNYKGTVAHAPEGVYFLSNRNTVELYNGQTFKTISENIETILDTMTAGLASGVYFRRHYYLNTYGDSKVYDYDIDGKSWWIHSFPTNYLRMTVNESLGNIVAIPAQGSSAQARVDKLFVSGLVQDRGSNYAWQWTSPWMNFGQPAVRKRLRKFHIDGNGTVDLSFAKDFGSYTTLGSNIFTAAATETEANVFSPGVARAASIKLGATANDDAEVDAMTIAFGFRKN